MPDSQCASAADCMEGHECVNGVCVSTSCSIEPVYFDFNENSIRLDQEEVVARNAACLKERLGTYVVEGHCDERGSDEYNLALSQRRAAAIVRAYQQHGLTKAMLSTLGFGEEKPICVDANDSCWQNRRVETLPAETIMRVPPPAKRRSSVRLGLALGLLLRGWLRNKRQLGGGEAAR